MDFAFVPPAGTDPGIRAAARLFAARLPASRLAPASANNLNDILDWVDGRLPAGSTLDTLFLVSHASDHHVSFRMTRRQKVDTVYTLLVDLQSATPAFDVPARFKAPPAAGTSPIQVVITGCRIGSSEAFLRLLKTLMGGQVEITAPRHYSGMTHIKESGASVILESLTYNIEAHSKDRIDTHAKLVEAFRKVKFVRYDGTQIPDADIEQALKQLEKKAVKFYLPDATAKRQLKTPLWFTLSFNENVAGKASRSLRTLSQLRAQRMSKTVAGMDLPSFSAKPILDHVADAGAAWEQTYRSPGALAGQAEKTYAEHLGLHAGEDPATMIDWKALDHTDPASKTKGKKIVGTYFRYQLLLPVTSVTDNTLLFDSEIIAGPVLSSPTTWPTVAAQRRALFLTV